MNGDDNYNYGFSGAVPEGVSIQYNVDRALEFQRNSPSAESTFIWFYEHERNNHDKHLPQETSNPDHSMDYKQIDTKDKEN